MNTGFRYIIVALVITACFLDRPAHGQCAPDDHNCAQGFLTGGGPTARPVADADDMWNRVKGAGDRRVRGQYEGLIKDVAVATKFAWRDRERADYSTQVHDIFLTYIDPLPPEVRQPVLNAAVDMVVPESDGRERIKALYARHLEHQDELQRLDPRTRLVRGAPGKGGKPSSGAALTTYAGFGSPASNDSFTLRSFNSTAPKGGASNGRPPRPRR